MATFPFLRNRNWFNQSLNRSFPPSQAGAIRNAFTLEAGVKATATGKTSDATLAIDTDLVIPDIIADVPYLIKMVCPCTATANGGLALNQAGGTVVAATYTGFTTFVTAAGAATTIIDVSALNTAQSPTKAAFVRVMHQAILIASSGGSFGIQWAQATSHSDTTTLAIGSYVTAEPLTALYAR